MIAQGIFQWWGEIAMKSPRTEMKSSDLQINDLSLLVFHYGELV